jgi:hypothetical protein
MDAEYLTEAHYLIKLNRLQELKELFEEYRKKNTYLKAHTYNHTFRLLFMNAGMHGNLVIAVWLYNELYMKLKPDQQKELIQVFKMILNKTKLVERFQPLTLWLMKTINELEKPPKQPEPQPQPQPQPQQEKPKELIIKSQHKPIPIPISNPNIDNKSNKHQISANSVSNKDKPREYQISNKYGLNNKVIHAITTLSNKPTAIHKIGNGHLQLQNKKALIAKNPPNKAIPNNTIQNKISNKVLTTKAQPKLATPKSVQPYVFKSPCPT